MTPKLKSHYTVHQLHKELGKLVEQGHGRLRIEVSKTSFRDNCEDDGCTILPISGVTVLDVLQRDDDGGTKTTKSGREVSRTTVIIFGTSGTHDQPWSDT